MRRSEISTRSYIIRSYCAMELLYEPYKSRPHNLTPRALVARRGCTNETRCKVCNSSLLGTNYCFYKFPLLFLFLITSSSSIYKIRYHRKRLFNRCCYNIWTFKLKKKTQDRMRKFALQISCASSETICEYDP